MELTEVSYPNRLHADTTAVALTYRAATAGHRGAPLEAPFTYCDIGCGTGVTLVALASVHPRAEFVGLDLSARHIEAARGLASDCDLENVRFLQRDINDADILPGRLFDFIVVHGLISWVPRDTAFRILTFAAERLAPGGLLFLSYNQTPQANRMAPIRRYLKTFAEDCPTRSPVEAIHAAFDHWYKGEQEIFPADSEQARFLAYLAGVPAEGLAHEFLVDDWHGWPCEKLHRLLEEQGLVLLCEGPVPDSEDESGRPFPIICRRDLFRKKAIGCEAPRDSGVLDDMAFCLSGHSGIAPYTVWTEGQRLALPEAVLRDIRLRLERGPWSLADYFHRQGQETGDKQSARVTLECLVKQGVLSLCLDGRRNSPGPCRPPVHVPLALNRLLLARDLDLGAYLLMSPVTGTAVGLQPLERLILRALQDDQPEAACLDAIACGDVALGEFQNAESLSARDLAGMVNGCVASFVEARLPVLARLGICEGR